MAEIGLALLFAVIVWWASTGLVFFLGSLTQISSVVTMTAMTVAGGLALYAIATTAADTSLWGVYVAFLSAIVVWAWVELSFLNGLVVGPRQLPCPPHAQGWERFWLATQTLIYHEILIVALAAALIALTWNAPNQIAAWTFMVLVVMRLSAKLNLFLGVPSFSDELLPHRLRHLKSYFGKRNKNLFFPLSVSVAVIGVVVLCFRITSGDLTDAMIAGHALVAGLLALAIIEHLFMVLPVREAALWRWVVPTSATGTGR